MIAFSLGLLLGALFMWAWTKHRIAAWKESNRQLAVTLRETRIQKFDVERELERANRLLHGDRTDPDWWKRN